MSRGSIINPLLTLDYMQTENENKFFDRKSGKIRPVDLAQHISGFANADVDSHQVLTARGFIQNNEAERQIINVIIETPSASQIEIAEMTGFSRSKVQRIMKELTKKKILYREGARKNGAWRVLDEQSRPETKTQRVISEMMLTMPEASFYQLMERNSAPKHMSQ